MPFYLQQKLMEPDNFCTNSSYKHMDFYIEKDLVSYLPSLNGQNIHIDTLSDTHTHSHICKFIHKYMHLYKVAPMYEEMVWYNSDQS